MSDAQCKSGEWEIPRDIPVYLASKEVLSTIVGFKFHRGVLALGRRPVPLSLVKAWPGIAEISRLLILPEINDVENLGAILRTAAGLGFGHVLLGPACCDPWSRRAIRTSMGAVFRLAIRRSNALQSDLERLRQDHGFRYHATVLDKSAMPLAAVEIPQKVGLILGPEADGLSDAWQSLADERVTIVMDLDTDSLNVTVAAGIFMYHYRRP